VAYKAKSRERFRGKVIKKQLINKNKAVKKFHK